MITIINKNEFLKNIASEIEKYHKSNTGLEVDISAKDIFDASSDVIESNRLIEHLILDEDKKEIELYLEESTYGSSGGYAIFFCRNINDVLVKLLKLQLFTSNLEDVEHFLDGNDFNINLFQTYDSKSEERIIFFRNKVSALPKMPIIKQKYDLIQNILTKFSRVETYVAGHYNYPILNTKSIKPNTVFDDFFTENFLMNNTNSDEDKKYFDNILNLEPYIARIETIWLYCGHCLKQLGFESKEEFVLFDEYLNKIKEDLSKLEIREVFHFRSETINLYVKTGLNYPLDQVFVKMVKDDSINEILNKELYVHTGINYVSEIKIEGILLLDYIKNKEEVLTLIQLLEY